MLELDFSSCTLKTGLFSSLNDFCGVQISSVGSYFWNITAPFPLRHNNNTGSYHQCVSAVEFSKLMRMIANLNLPKQESPLDILTGHSDPPRPRFHKF